MIQLSRKILAMGDPARRSATRNAARKRRRNRRRTIISRTILAERSLPPAHRSHRLAPMAAVVSITVQPAIPRPDRQCPPPTTQVDVGDRVTPLVTTTMDRTRRAALCRPFWTRWRSMIACRQPRRSSSCDNSSSRNKTNDSREKIRSKWLIDDDIVCIFYCKVACGTGLVAWSLLELGFHS